MKRNWNLAMNDAGPEQEKYREILLDVAGKARNYTKRYGILMYSTASLYFVSPFVGMQGDTLRIRKYPFFGWYYFDRFSDLYYGLCYASQVWIILYLISVAIKKILMNLYFSLKLVQGFTMHVFHKCDKVSTVFWKNRITDFLRFWEIQVPKLKNRMAL